MKAYLSEGGYGMSRVCAVSGKKALSGNRRSHSLRATRRTWGVNLQKVMEKAGTELKFCKPDKTMCVGILLVE